LAARGTWHQQQPTGRTNVLQAKRVILLILSRDISNPSNFQNWQIMHAARAWWWWWWWCNNRIYEGIIITEVANEVYQEDFSQTRSRSSGWSCISLADGGMGLCVCTCWQSNDKQVSSTQACNSTISENSSRSKERERPELCGCLLALTCFSVAPLWNTKHTSHNKRTTIWAISRLWYIHASQREMKIGRLLFSR
jgi:hypothetical protein